MVGMRIKHPSRWPWLLRAPLCIAATLLVWWGPPLGLILALTSWEPLRGVSGVIRAVVAIVFLFGWSIFILRTVVHAYIEPFFNLRSQQNPHHDRFTPEPVHSIRDWLRLMFRGR